MRFTSYDEVRAGPLHGVGFGQRLVSLAQLAAGTAQALVLISRRQPDVLLLTGGWVGLPVALAAKLRGVPSLIYLPDIEPGLTIQVLRRFASRVAVTAEQSRPYFRADQMVVTGYPLRCAMLEATREAAQSFFRIDPARNVLLVFGGSRGARTINHALMAMAPALLADGVQIIHISGTLDWDEVRTFRGSLPDATDYHAYPYLHREMGLAMAAADLAVSRSGASTLGEFPYFGLPSILVPYPYAWRYQKVNADYLAERGAALVMNDADMERDLLTTVRGLLADPPRLAAIRAAASSLSQPDAAGRIADQLEALAAGDAR